MNPLAILAGAVGIGVLILVLVVLIRTAFLRSLQPESGTPDPLPLDESVLVEHLAQAVCFQTVSRQDQDVNLEPFVQFHRYLQEAFPRVHAALIREPVNTHSLLYTWTGQNPALEPILLMGHMDVVPIEEGTEQDWECPPFEGLVKDDCVWGRGTLDDKQSVLGVLEAVEALLGEGFVPQRTVYLAFGHDEEFLGEEGAAQIVALLQKRGVRLAAVLDEGLALVEGMLPGYPGQVALVGIAEKGYLSVELCTEDSGGHAMAPSKTTAIGTLGTAIHTLLGHPFPLHLPEPTRGLLHAVAPELPALLRLVLGNLWIFGPVVKWVFAGAPATEAMVRTTIAPTVLASGTKENVLPTSAKAVVNIRLLSGESVASALDHVRHVVGEAVTVKLLGRATEPSPVSSPDALPFRMLAQTIRQVFPEAIVAPGLMLGASDSRYYAAVCDNVYRFLPFLFTGEDLERVHGSNERIKISAYVRGVRFYAQWIRNMTR